MNRAIAFTCSAVFIFTTAYCEPPAQDTPDDGERISGRVVNIADGDTLTIRTADGNTEKIRLFGIDAPERGQPFGRKAQAALDAMIAGKTVTVKIEDRDQYGRLVGVVFRDTTNLNAAMLEQGMAWVYRKYTHDAEWIALETRARSERRGLWRDPNPVPPREWRKRHSR